MFLVCYRFLWLFSIIGIYWSLQEMANLRSQCFTPAIWHRCMYYLTNPITDFNWVQHLCDCLDNLFLITSSVKFKTFVWTFFHVSERGRKKINLIVAPKSTCCSSFWILDYHYYHIKFQENLKKLAQQGIPHEFRSTVWKL